MGKFQRGPRGNGEGRGYAGYCDHCGTPSDCCTTPPEHCTGTQDNLSLDLHSFIFFIFCSITQVVDVVSYCNKNKLPFDLDKVVEVNHRLWKIQAVMPVDRDLEQKHEQHVVDAENTGGEMMLQVKYAAKPSFQQLPHTG